MAKKQSLKKALITSAVSMVLCSSMFVGTTFAWFTDSVTSTSNVIKTGTLDIEMSWAKGNENPTTADWTDASKGAIFNNDKWEPGYMEARHIKIENKGTLALKYTLSIVPNGEVSDLADVIDVYYADGETKVVDGDRDLSGLKYAGSLRYVINSGIKSGSLLAENKATDVIEEVYTATIVLKMRDDAGNEYMNQSIGSNFSVQLLATQYTYEKDTIDKDYDQAASAVPGTYIELNENENLLAAMKSADVKPGEPLTIKLLGNVAFNAEEGSGDITKASSIVIDGNGYTLTATGQGVNAFGDNDAPMTLKNLTVVDKTTSSQEGSWEYSYLEMGKSVLNCENVTFMDPIMVESKAANFTYCSFVGKHNENPDLAMYGVWVANGNTNFTSCTFTGTRGMKICDRYQPEVGTVVIDGCTFSNLSEKPGVAIDDWDQPSMNITIKNSKFIGCQPGDQGNYIYELSEPTYSGDIEDKAPTLVNNEVIADPTLVSDEATLSTAIADGRKNIMLTSDIAINANDTITVNAGAKIFMDLNGHTLSGNADKTGNEVMFLVKGEVTVFNGKVQMETTQNQGWNAMTAIFNVENGGVLNIKDAEVRNSGGTDMAIGVHLNNAANTSKGDVTLNVDNSKIFSTYCAVRVFNSGYTASDNSIKNNVTITNSTLDAGKEGKALWVHCYKAADFGNNDTKAEQAAKNLNMNVLVENPTPIGDDYVYGDDFNLNTAANNTLKGYVRYGYEYGYEVYYYAE